MGKLVLLAVGVFLLAACGDAAVPPFEDPEAGFNVCERALRKQLRCMGVDPGNPTARELIAGQSGDCVGEKAEQHVCLLTYDCQELAFEETAWNACLYGVEP